jgi:hypothetical protein
MISVSASRAFVAAACSAVVIGACGCSDDDSTPDEPSSTRSEHGAARHDGPSGQPDRDAEASETEQSDPGYRAELARIERAKPEPPVDTSREDELRRAKKVRGPGGVWFYVLPREREPTATAPLRGCVKRSPQPPGVTARRIAPEKVLVTYRIPDGDEDCRAEWIGLTADVSGDFQGGLGKRFPIPEERAGQIVLPLTGHVVDADILVASTRTEENSGYASRTTIVRIR